MSDSQRPSSIPPSRKRYAAVTALIASLATLLGAIATKIVLAPEAVVPPRVTAEPAKPPPDSPLPEIPRDLDSSAADRFVRNSSDAALRDLRARVTALEALVCTLKLNARQLEARHVRERAGKRAVEARDDFLARTGPWEQCPAVQAGDKPQQLPALHEAADSALRR